MKSYLVTALAAAAFCLVAPTHAAPPSVNPEIMDMDVETSALIAKEKSKRTFSIADGVKASQSGSSSSNPCGSVNINSQQPTDKKSLSGISDMFGKQSTTVVTGPVINMANCK